MINRAFITASKQANGLNKVNGIPHGFKWKPIWTVNVECDTEEQAQLIKAEFDKRIKEELK